MSSKGAPRRYGFACFMCRRRKIRCDGKKPNCANCLKAKEICNYKESPSYNAHLVNQLQQSQRRAEDLESQLRDLASLDHEERDRRLAGIVRDFDTLQLDAEPDHITEASWDEEKDEDLPFGKSVDFSVGEDGTYFGATSRFHPLESGDDPLPRAPGPEGKEHTATEEYHRRWLASNARFQESIEKVALGNLHQHTDLDIDVCTTLLEIYWTWQAPLHNCVYRRCFYRDLALGGPYFSPFLLNVIFAHACRHMKDDDPKFASLERGRHFMQKAKQLLLIEMEQDKPKICTIQGLLILGGRQCAIGKSSEGWLYTGMANRMIVDLGLNLYKGNMNGLDGLEPDDLEVRKRLYLSAFAWDKSISLCLGRPPSLPDLPFSPDSLFDVSDNDAEWKPFYLKGMENPYPFTKSYNTLNFVHFCKLAKLINESYEMVYNRNIQDLKLQTIFKLEKKLRAFHSTLPDELRPERAASSSHCLPPHIFCLNILYHTMLILIFRPFFGWSQNPKLQDHALAVRAQKVCTESASKVNEFFRQYGRTFNFQNQTYLVSYCVYTAATIDIQQIRHEDPSLASAAANRLSTTLKMLESEARQTPGIKRSIEIIKSHLTQATEQLSVQLPAENPELAQPKSTTRQHSLPESVSDYSSSYSEPMIPSPPERQVNRLGPNMVAYPSRFQPNTPLVTDILSAQVTYDTVPDENIGTLMSQAMDVDATWTDWDFFNAGGGFVPDNGNWAPADPYNFNAQYQT